MALGLVVVVAGKAVYRIMLVEPFGFQMPMACVFWCRYRTLNGTLRQRHKVSLHTSLMSRGKKHVLLEDGMRALPLHHLLVKPSRTVKLAKLNNTSSWLYTDHGCYLQQQSLKVCPPRSYQAQAAALLSQPIRSKEVTVDTMPSNRQPVKPKA